MEFQDDFIVPDDFGQTRGQPQQAARANAFYTTELNPEVEQDSETIAQDLEFTGVNPAYDEALKRWSEVQQVTDRRAVIDILTDGSISPDRKVDVVRRFDNGEFASSNLKDQYVQDISTRDVPEFGEEDIGSSQEDIEAQELWLDQLQKNLDSADEVQAIKTSYAAGLNPDSTMATAGLISEVLSPLDLHSLRSAITAKNLGINVRSKDIFGGETLFGVSREELEKSDDLASTIFSGLFGSAESVASLFDNSLFDIPRNFLFAGTLNKKVNEIYEKATPEQKKEILTKILDSVDNVPGTDFQKSFAFREQVEEGLSTVEANLADVLGTVGAYGAVQFFKNPVRGVKWYTTFEGSGLPAAFRNTDVQIKDSSKTIPTLDSDVVISKEKPTGKGEVNATDNTISSTENIDEITLGERVVASDKVFVQPGNAPKDNVIVGLDNTKAIGGLERLIEEGKTSKQASISFEKAKTVETPIVKISEDGKVSFVNGQDRYSAISKTGATSIPVSMDRQSVLNALKNKYINKVPPKETNLNVAETTRMTRLSVDPTSPAGLVSKANPVEASNKYTQALTDPTDATVRSMGTNKASIIADSVLPKLDIALEETFPNVASNIRKMDEDFLKSINNPEATQLEEAVTRVKELDTEKYLRVLKESTTGFYNQANSTVHIGKNKAEGIATFGRNKNYGWKTREEAQNVANGFPEGSNTRIVERNGTFWVESKWTNNFDHIDRFMFNEHSMDSSILGVDTSFITRESIGDWIFPTTMKGDPDVAKQGFLSELKANANEIKFFGLIKKEILSTPHRRDLQKAMNITQEEQRWLTLHDLRDMNAHLTKGQLESLSNSYFSYKRGSDYAYELSNKLHRSQLEADNFKGVYNTETGEVVGHGKEVTTKPAEVYSFSKQAGVPPEEGYKIIELNEPINVEGRLYKHAILDEGIVLNSLPSRTLPKLEGWVPRKNKENYFIEFTPNSVVVDGRNVPADELRKHSKVVGAGRTLKEAEEFSKRLSKEHAGGTLKVREAAENAGDVSLEDYKLYSDVVRNNRKRGERLRTLHGYARLEDPLEAFASTVRSLTRLNAWQPFKTDFEKSFMNFADKYIPEKYGQKTFPNDTRELILPMGSTRQEVKEFKVAQRLLDQYKEMQYSATFGDRAWRSVFNSIASTIEDIGWAKEARNGAGVAVNKLFRGAAEGARAIGGQGNIAVKASKSLATTLFINLNPPRQWIIQPQQLLELNAISPSYAKKSPTEIPAIITAVLSRAPHMEKYNKVAYEAAKKASLMNGKEFDDTVKALYDVGLPQSVDLNQMLYGTLDSAKFKIDPSGVEKSVDTLTNIVKAPGRVGKSIGYTPAEMANNIGTWLYSRERWKNNNPGKNWNTPENIARITADAWDISHSMIGRAGTMSFQNGALGVLFQFVAVQQKGFMQLLSSKTLTPAEKTKLTAARLVLYGGYGIPLGAVGLSFVDKYVNENASPEVKQVYNVNRGGIVDALANTTLDVMFADPDTEWEIVGDAFTGKLAGRSDVSVSKIMSPIPDTVPLLEMLIELSNFTDNSKTNPRFPGPQAVGSLAEAVSDIKSLWNAGSIDSAEKLELAARGLAETASIYNNYGKSVTLKQYRDKESKLGTRYGLTGVTEGEVFAQKLGFTTREEELLWANINLDKERTQHISSVSNEVFRRFQKMERLLGTADYETEKARLNELLELSVEPNDLNEVIEQVNDKLMSDFRSGTIKDTLYNRHFSIRKDNNNAKSRELINNIQQSATRNEGDAKVLEMLINAGLVGAE